jgi:SAM-dependent methyltransferase
VKLTKRIKALLPRSIKLRIKRALSIHGLRLRGTCPVCGSGATFFGFTASMRESGLCSACGSFNRQRQVAFVLRRTIDVPMTGALRLPDGFGIYNTEARGSVHTALRKHSGYVCSEFFGPEHVPGATVRGVRNEDLQRLTFPDRTFDIVLSSDVLEHVPDPYKAHHEILRVLKPGGSHIFTVPHGPLRDAARAKIVNGQMVYLAEKQFHGDPLRPEEGAFVWTDFGRQDMLPTLEAMGFKMSIYELAEPTFGIIGEGAIVFCACKAEPN